MMNDKGSAMHPFVVKELVGMVMEKKGLLFDDALFYVYSSDLFAKLLDEEAKMWYLSTASLYDMLEQEKRAKRRKKPEDKILMFRIYCLELYCEARGVCREEALAWFRQCDVFGLLDDTFDVLHTQGETFIMETIEEYIKSWRKRK